MTAIHDCLSSAEVRTDYEYIGRAITDDFYCTFAYNGLQRDFGVAWFIERKSGGTNCSKTTLRCSRLQNSKYFFRKRQVGGRKRNFQFGKWNILKNLQILLKVC